jgi:probable biosynthetic protein (TIGR04098 family)
MSCSVVGLPQSDASGLSENWLFKHCGEEQWRRLFAALGAEGANSPQLCSDAGVRLYATFVAIRARYSHPLGEVRLDDRFHTSSSIAHYGRAFFHGRATVRNARMRFELEMLNTFVARTREGCNALRQSLPSAGLAYRSAELDRPPELLKLSQAVRRGEWSGYRFRDDVLPQDEQTRTGEWSAVYDPSPYFDYNGAGLLYFAAIPTIVDTLERRIVNAAGLVDGERDWALQSSTVARDVFYHRNLDLGARLGATLRRFERRGDAVLLCTRVFAEADGAVLADVITEKRLVAARPLA